MAQIQKKTAKKTTKKPLVKQKDIPVTATDTKERKRKVQKYKSFRLQKRIPHPKGPLPPARIIIKKSILLITSCWKPLTGVVLVFGLLHFIFVRGLALPLDVNSTKTALEDALGTELNGFNGVGAVFGALLSSPNGSGSEASNVYQALLFIVVSLAVIWLFRQKNAGKAISVKAAFYQGMYPIVPFLLVLLAFLVQLVPAYIGNMLYSIITTNGIAVTGFEQAVWLLLYLGLLLLSLYMVCSSLFAMYVVTLPEITPMQALRSSRQLVFSRRFSIFRKLLILPILGFLTLIVILVPFIYFIPGLASWVFVVLGLVSIVFLHAYLYTLYKELL